MDLIAIDRSRFLDAVKAYWLWKELNSLIRNSHNRGVNFPETISETVACYALGYRLNKGTGGDALDPKTNRIIEFKATSNWKRDLSSFSPSSNFDNLVFIRLNQREDKAYVYDLKINSEELKKVKVNKTQTLEDQQMQGRRPRFSIIRQVINKTDLMPISKVDFRLQETEMFDE